MDKHDRYVEERQKNFGTCSRSKYFVSESLYDYPRINQVDLENIQNPVGPLKAKRGRKRIRAESLEHESPEDTGAEVDEIRQATVSIERNGLKLIDSQSSSSDEDDSRERLDYNNITHFFIETNACKIKSLEKGKVKTLKDISIAAIKEFQNLTALFEGIPACVLDELKILPQLTNRQLFDVEKLFRKKDRLWITDKFWKNFCEQHYNYFFSKNGKTYKDIYIKSSRFFLNEARRVDRGVKRRYEKLKKDIDKSVLPVWDRSVSLDEWDGNNDDTNDYEYHEIDYPENSQDF